MFFRSVLLSLSAASLFFASPFNVSFVESVCLCVWCLCGHACGRACVCACVPVWACVWACVRVCVRACVCVSVCASVRVLCVCVCVCVRAIAVLSCTPFGLRSHDTFLAQCNECKHAQCNECKHAQCNECKHARFPFCRYFLAVADEDCISLAYADRLKRPSCSRSQRSRHWCSVYSYV